MFHLLPDNDIIAGQYHLEPINNLADRTIAGYEVLCKRPGGKWVEKDAAMLRNIGAIVNKAAGFISVNMATDSIISCHESLIESAAEKCNNLIIEWIETPSSEHGIKLAGSILQRWRSKYGVGISIDDMCSGHDGMERFLAANPDIAKIDGKILHKARSSDKYFRAMRHVCEWCHQEGATVVIEWIENERDLDMAMETSARYGQGFLFMHRE